MKVSARTKQAPYQGFYHQPRYGRPALALDLMEEFRPLVADSVVIGLTNNGEVRPSDFLTRAGAVALTEGGRRRVLEAFERWLDTLVTHPRFGTFTATRRRPPWRPPPQFAVMPIIRHQPHRTLPSCGAGVRIPVSNRCGLESGLSYRQVQMMSKHRDPKTVMRYDHGRENLDQSAVNFLKYEEEESI